MKSLRSILVLLSLGGSLAAATYQVSPDGNDAATGTQLAPWKRLAHAAAMATAGDIVEVRGGVYPERVVFPRSGTIDAPIIFRAFPAEIPIIDGSLLVPGTGSSALFQLSGLSYVQIEGFELRNYRTSARNRIPIGIYVTGSGTGVKIVRNHIHHIETNYTGANGGDAHGIAIYGNSVSPINNIVVLGNHLENLKLGSSEAMVLNGNVTGFLVDSNQVHDCNNIGIDLIGYEGTCPDVTQDAARNGIVRRNSVSKITSRGNPAYGQDRSAGGIYVDGGRDILIEKNTVTTCDIGIECASEHAGKGTSRIHLRNNIIFQNTIGGIFLGGYDTARGYTDACRIEHNTLWENDTAQDGNGEIFLQFDVRNSSFRHNIIMPNTQGLVVGNPYAQNTANTLNYNLISAPTGTNASWQWKNSTYNSFAAWKSATGQDVNSLTANPLLLDPANGQFGLRPKSAAIDAGDAGFVSGEGETDRNDRPRIKGLKTDLGALEFDLKTFAFGDPQKVVLVLHDSRARLTYGRRPDWAALSLEFFLEISDDLTKGVSAWTRVTDITTLPSVPPSPGENELVTLEFTFPSGPHWFARMRTNVLP